MRKKINISLELGENSYTYEYPSKSSLFKNKVKDLKNSISSLEKNFYNKQTNFIESENYKIAYEKELNPKQLEACMTITGKTLVIAGAGSGKTKTLTYRTSYLLENNINPNEILILTFTKRSAEEIKIRVNKLLESDIAHPVTSGTFHSFCNMLLLRYAKLLEINPNFTIIDQQDAQHLIGILKERLDIKKQGETIFPKKSIINTIISTSRNKIIPISTIINENYPHFKIYIPQIIQISENYDKYKRENHLYDYDDLIDQIIFHLKSNSAFKEKLHNKYRHIMVDEYQDTNLPQKTIIDFLAEKSDNSLMVVGDDNQSIYAFRGANYENILLFGKEYPNSKLIKLEQNYRSTPKILDFVNGISERIELGYKKTLFSKNTILGTNPQFIRCSSQETEACFIADEILKIKDTICFREMAILCRSSFHSNFIQTEFTKRNIPFRVFGGIGFIEKRHIKDILAYIKILHNRSDFISWTRVLTLLKGIGHIKAEKIFQDVCKSDMEFLDKKDYIQDDENLKLLFKTLRLAYKTAYNIDSLSMTFRIIEKYYIQILKNIEQDWKKRIEDFRVLRSLCSEYENIEKFLSHLTLDPPTNHVASLGNSTEHDEDYVTISTIHSAKGLEWNTVFVICLIDGAVPHYKSLENCESLEEERKLFYVACSRAKEELNLTSFDYFTTYSGYFDNPCRFIIEIPNEKYDYNIIEGSE